MLVGIGALKEGVDGFLPGVFALVTALTLRFVLFVSPQDEVTRVSLSLRSCSKCDGIEMTEEVQMVVKL